MSFSFRGKDGIHLFHAKVGDEKENEKPKGGEGGFPLILLVWPPCLPPSHMAFAGGCRTVEENAARLGHRSTVRATKSYYSAPLFCLCPSEIEDGGKALLLLLLLLSPFQLMSWLKSC